MLLFTFMTTTQEFPATELAEFKDLSIVITSKEENITTINFPNIAIPEFESLTLQRYSIVQLPSLKMP